MKRPSGDSLLLAALIAVQLVPLWTLSYFPSQDGPAHLAVANVLREYGGPGGQVLREYFALEGGAVTNWFVYFLLAHVLRFLPLALAEKVFLSAYVILLPLSVRYAVRSVAPRNAFLALLALPFTYNYLLGMGFYNFCASLVAFFFALGYWLRYGPRRRERLGWLHGAAFAVLTLWVYLCHVVSVGALLAAVGTLAAWDARSDLRVRSLVRRLGPTTLALMPTLVLMLAFVGRAASTTTSIPAREKLMKLLTLEMLASFDPRTRYVGYAAAVLFGVLALWAFSRRSDGWLAVFAVFVALVLAVPSNVGVGGFIELRLSLFPFFALLLWLAGSDPPAPLRRGIMVAAAGLTLALLGLLWTRWRILDGYLAEYLSAGERIEAGSTVLPLSYSHFGTGPDGSELTYRIQPFVHAASHIAAGKPVADLRLYAANYEGYFPVHYRPELNPYRHIAQGYWAERVPPWVEFLTYPRRTGGRVDYVLIWQVPEERRHPAIRSLWRQLRTGYERVWVSPRGLAEVYRDKRRDKRARRIGARTVPTAR